MNEATPQTDWSDVRQGDLLTVEVDQTISGALDLPVGSLEDVVVVSQTCDVVQAGREYVTLGRLDRPAEAGLASAESGASPRWARLPLGDDRFVDLHRLVSARKLSVGVRNRRPGIQENDWDGERRFAQAVGRNFSRYAFPDDLVPWVDPLRRQLADKASRLTSAVGRVLEDIVEVRLGASDWSRVPLELTIYLIVAVGRIGEPDGPASSPTREWLRAPRSLTQIAERLRPADGSRPPSSDEIELFDAFAEAVTRLCQKAGSDHPVAEIRGAVSLISTDVRSEDEFGLNLVRRTERFDIDYLSPPTLSN